MTFLIVPYAQTIYGSNAKNRKKISMADFFQIPFFSELLWVAIFAILSWMFNFVLFITPDQTELERWNQFSSKDLQL